MTALSLGLVLISALAHSTWNFLLKRSGDKQVFMWLLLVSASVLLVPVGAALFWLHPFGHPGWAFILATIALHMLYFVFLGRGYTQGDLSLVYPIARGISPMLVPILAVVVLSESIAGPAIIGIVAIVIGIYTVSWWGNFGRLLHNPLYVLKNPGTRYAILSGLAITGFAIVDKRGVDHVQPFLYMYLMTLGSALGLSPFVLRKWGIAFVGREWRANSGPIVAAGLLTFLAYGLVLTAFSLSRVSYVAPAREVGIVVGVLMGVFLLKEPFGGGRLLGSGFIVLGLVLVAVSP
jgi:drug/metabolite transporter (DMT)-like permease